METRLVPLDARTGERLWVRQIRSTDAPELQRAFADLSHLSRYQRFLTGTPAMSDNAARFFSEIDQVNHVALVALPSRDSTNIVGVARFIRYTDTPTEADLAVTVAEAWQRRGLGTGLLRLLSERARAVGIRRFTLDMLADNAAMHALVRAAGGEAGAPQGQVVTGHIDLGPCLPPHTEARGSAA